MSSSRFVIKYNDEVKKMNKKIGFIGCGNMAKAMITSIIKHYAEEISLKLEEAKKEDEMNKKK